MIFEMLIDLRYHQLLISDGVLVKVGLRYEHGLPVQGHGSDRALKNANLMPCSSIVQNSLTSCCSQYFTGNKN